MILRKNGAILFSTLVLTYFCSFLWGQSVEQKAENLGAHDGELHVAARAGDTDKINRLLNDGVDVNFKNRYGLTALYYAADRGHTNAVRTLIEAGAELEIPNEPFYRLNPLIMAVRKNHVEVTRLLLKKGATCGSWTAMWPANLNHTEVVKVLVELRPEVYKESVLNQLAGIAQGNENEELLKFLIGKGATAEPSPYAAEVETNPLSRDDQIAVDGIYQVLDESESTRVWARRGTLYLGNEFELASELKRVSNDEFEMIENPDVRIKFSSPMGSRLQIIRSSKGEDLKKTDRRMFVKVKVHAPTNATTSGSSTSKARWTRFRGADGTGNADGLDLPVAFDATLNKGVAWKTRIPGVGHSSPVIWDDNVFLTSAEPVSKEPKYDLRVASGFDTHQEDIEYRWIAYCVSLSSGKIKWQKQLDQGRPRAKRHVMSSHANCTPSVDGEHVIVNLAGQGIYCLTHDGEIKWEKDLGKLAAGWFMDPGYEWGFASSPVLRDKRVYLQCDVFEGSFISVLNSEDGEEIWRTKREEVSSWGTPLLMNIGDEFQIIANGTRAICGYDAAHGKELWRIEDNSEITVASPIPNGNHVVVTGGYQPVKPIFSIDISERGNLTPPKDAQPTGQPGLQWWLPTGGAYSITPIIYRDLLYVFQSNGVLTTFEAGTGKKIYKKRVVSGRSGDIVASPIVSDSKIYVVGGDGDVFVLRAGPEYERPTVCPIGEQVMATPAAAPGRLVIRGLNHLFCFSSNSEK